MLREWAEEDAQPCKLFSWTLELTWLISEGVKFSQSCLILCNPMDYSPPGSSVHEILQTRMLEWVAIPFSRASASPRDQTWVSSITDRFFAIWATREDRAHWAHKFHETDPHPGNVTRDVTAWISTDLSLPLRSYSNKKWDLSMFYSHLL